MIRDSDGTPVQLLVVAHTFRSKAAAAKFLNTHYNSVHRAVEEGTQVCGFWVRYSDMPAKFQPLKNAQSKPVRRDDGVIFPSMIAAVKDLFPNAAEQQLHNLYENFRHAIKRGLQWHGHHFFPHMKFTEVEVPPNQKEVATIALEPPSTCREAALAARQ